MHYPSKSSKEIKSLLDIDKLKKESKMTTLNNIKANIYKKQKGFFSVKNNICKILFALGLGGASLSSAGAVGLCFDNDKGHCLSSRIGVGASYYNVNANTAKANPYGGFINGELIESYKRFQGFIGIRLGLGSIDYSGATFENLGKQQTALNADVKVKLGVNVLTKNIPLFVNLVLGDDYLNASGNQSGFNKNLLYLGLEAQGKIPIASKSRIEYGAGFNLISGWYEFGKTYAAKSHLKGFNYGISATLGYAQDIDERKEWYVRAIGKYENLGTSSNVPFYANYDDSANPSSRKNYPASQNFGVMIEAGIGY